jgi:hypothetical protein
MCVGKNNKARSALALPLPSFFSFLSSSEHHLLLTCVGHYVSFLYSLLLKLSCCVCSSVLHHGLDECVFLYMCMHA